MLDIETQNDIGVHLIAATDKFRAFVIAQRRRHRKQLCMASLVAVLIGAVLYETQWPDLRYGLLVLLAGQVGDILSLFSRNVQLSKDMDQIGSGVTNEAVISASFEGEKLFIKRLALFESVCQIIGFLILGYAFWMATRNLWIALAISFVYPVALHAGVTRRRNLDAIRQISAKEHEIMSTMTASY